MCRIPWRSALPIFLLGATVTTLFMINLCDLIFDCGCRSWWAGGVEHCNIHDPNSRHCPWCSVGDTGFALIWVGMVMPQAVLSLFPPRWAWPKRLGATLAAFAVFGILIGIVMGVSMGYWD